MGNTLEPTTRPQIIQDPGEVPLVLYSDVRAPLGSLSFLRRSLALAELALISYNDEVEARRAARAVGFPQAGLIEHDGSQAFRFANAHDVVIACRGTEPTEWNDIRADANAALAVVGTMAASTAALTRKWMLCGPRWKWCCGGTPGRFGFAGIRWGARWRRCVPFAARPRP
jgi:hypothetical protein